MPVNTFADPTLDGGVNAWTKSSGTAAWPLLDDGIRWPSNPRTSGDGGYIRSQTNNQINVIGFANTINYVPGSGWILWIFGSGGTLRALDVTVSNDDAASWQTRQTGIIPAGAAPGWYALNVAEWIADQGDLNGFRVRLICASTGAGPATDVQVDAVYLHQSAPDPTVYEDAPTGALPLTGSTDESKAVSESPTGALALSGAASASHSTADTVAGALALTGSLVESHEIAGSEYADAPTGDLTLGGAVTDELERSDALSGAVGLSGAIVETYLPRVEYVDAPEGTIVPTGVADERLERGSFPEGLVALLGAATELGGYEDAPVGELVLTGSVVEDGPAARTAPFFRGRIDLDGIELRSELDLEPAQMRPDFD